MPGPVDDSVTIHVQARQEAIPGLVDMPSPSMWTWPATSVRYLPPTTPSFPRSRNQFKTNPTMNRACTGVDQPAISDAVPAPTPANVRTPPATPDPQQPMMLVLDAATVATRWCCGPAMRSNARGPSSTLIRLSEPRRASHPSKSSALQDCAVHALAACAGSIANRPPSRQCSKPACTSSQRSRAP